MKFSDGGQVLSTLSSTMDKRKSQKSSSKLIYDGNLICKKIHCVRLGHLQIYELFRKINKIDFVSNS